MPFLDTSITMQHKRTSLLLRMQREMSYIQRHTMQAQAATVGMDEDVEQHSVAVGFVIHCTCFLRFLRSRMML